jgi:hypothetical protein
MSQTKKRKNRAKGWRIVKIEGDAYTRGIQHGEQLADLLALLSKNLPDIVKHEMHVSFQQYLEDVREKIRPIFLQKCKEWTDEINGICQGASQMGVAIDFDTILAWNAMQSMYSFYKKIPLTRCSAFIATGEATHDGEIVMAHNTHCDYLLAPYSKVIMYVYPSQGHSFVMQTGCGLICSSMDWFICSSGIVGCETTIGGYTEHPTFGLPYFARIRQCMQYGDSLDDYIEIMKKENAGDYASCWQFGNLNTGEIVLLELGKNIVNVERTSNGIFYGMNTVLNPEIRRKETDDKSLLNLKTSSGSRNHRLQYLLYEKYYGKLTAKNAMKIMADHYDPYMGKTRKGARTICKHVEFEPEKTRRRAYAHYGVIDGKAVDTAMARKMEFMGRWGSSCGRTLNVKKYVAKHPVYRKTAHLLEDFKSYPWIKIGPTMVEK